MALSYINNKEIKFGSSKPLNGVYTPGSPTREYEPLDSLGIYLNSGIPLSYGVENGRYMSMSDEFAATSQGNSYSFNQLFAAQMMLGFKLHDRFIACDTEHKIIGTEPLLHKAYLAEITEKTLDYFKIKIYGDKTRTFCIRMSSSEVPTSYVDLTNSFDENGLNLTQTDRLSFLSYYRFYPLTVRALSTRVVETLGKGCYFLPSSESLGELSGDILSKFNAFISSDGNTLTSLGDTAFAYMGDVVYAVNYGGKITESLLDTKVDYTDLLTYEQIMATTPLFDLDKTAPKASAFKSHAKVFTSSITTPYSANNISLIRAGNVVQCSYYGNTISPIPNGSITFGNIPDGYKPITQTGTEIMPNGNNILIYTYLNILRGYNYRGSEYSGSFRFSMTWITNDPFPTT